MNKKDLTKDQVKKLLLDRIKINEKTECWEWIKSFSGSGYGRIRLTHFQKHYRKVWLAHRLSYSLFVSDFPNNLFICHKCDNKKCINPSHLFVGSHTDNMRDMSKKGRAKTPLNFGNNYNGKKTMAEFKIFKNCCEAGRFLGISDNGVRKRIKLNWPGYMFLD